MAAGRVKIHAMAMLRTVESWSPDPFAAMVPATPEDRTWVVETGSPYMSAAAIVPAATSSAAAPSIGQIGLADFLADGDHDALPAAHCTETECDRVRPVDPGRHEL